MYLRRMTLNNIMSLVGSMVDPRRGKAWSSVTYVSLGDNAQIPRGIKLLLVICCPLDHSLTFDIFFLCQKCSS